MIEFFNNDGHLSDQAFGALLADDPLDELNRLEIAEHLSFCDLCIEKYTALLTGEALLAPPEPVVPPVLRRLRERARRLFISKYTTVVAAASIAIVFWNVGVFNIDTTGNSKMLDALSRSGSAVTISQTVTEFSANLSQAFRSFAQSISIERGFNQNEKK